MFESEHVYLIVIISVLFCYHIVEQGVELVGWELAGE